jgi:hypothetical protein
MTEDEKRQQKGMLLLEFQEAEHNLANLREKAGRLGQQILQFGGWLAGASPERGPNIHTEENKKKSAQIRLNLDAYRKALNLEEAVALMDEIEKTERNLAALAMRKAELGLK